jgi:hypothetical protein
MHRDKRVMAWINVIGGVAVLGSYVHGIWTHPGTAGDVWGGVPEWLEPFYTVSMLTAAAGYLAFTYFLFFRADAEEARVADRFSLRLFNALYVMILLPSALWMPLTFAMLDDPHDGLWMLIRLVLAFVGIGSLAMIAALLAIAPRRPTVPYWLAVAGSVAFSVQTALLDAIVWPAYFPV